MTGMTYLGDEVPAFRDEGFLEALENEEILKVLKERSVSGSRTITFEELIMGLGITLEDLTVETESGLGVDLFYSSQFLVNSIREEMLYSMDDGSHCLLPVKPL